MGRNALDSSLRERLRSVFDRAKLPTNPVIATEVLSLVNDPDSTAEQFARVIENDAALAARLMKMGNSALFATRHPVTTIQRAVTVLGLRRIRMAAVSFQLVAHLDRLGQVPFDLTGFWQQSVLRACLAREVARNVVPALAEEAFLVGLLQDCGMLLLVQLLGDEYAELFRDGDLTPLALYAAEQRRCRHNHIEVIEAMAEEWGLPETLAKALASHHRPTRLAGKSSEADRLCAVSYFVGSMRLQDHQTTAEAEPRLMEYAERELRLGAAALEEIFRHVADAYEEVSGLFGEVLPHDIDVTELLMEANRQLTIAASASDERARQLKAERDLVNRERQTLRSAVAQYREKAARDPLTGVLNRGALLESTHSILHDVQEHGHPVTVFFLDIDNFKQLNDEHGHQVGDTVLKKFAHVATESVRNAGIVGRYGGEEFVVVMPGLTDEEARTYAERLVRTIRHMDVADLRLKRAVTCSLGAVSGRGDRSPQELFTLADQLMYEAKRAGKDRAVFKPLDDEPDRAPSDGETLDKIGAAMQGAAGGAATGLARLQEVASRLNADEPAAFLNARKQPRRAMLAACRFSYIVGPSLDIRSEDACVRNVSAGGIGVVFNRAMVRGDLVELCMRQQESPLYVAGLVSFCRHVDRDVYEIGVQVICNDRRPIISEDPADAIERFNWVARAVHEKYGDLAPRRKSA